VPAGGVLEAVASVVGVLVSAASSSDDGVLRSSGVKRSTSLRACGPRGSPRASLPPLDLGAADPGEAVVAVDVEAGLGCRWSRVEALRSSRTDDFPSAWGHLPIHGLREDAAAARHRHVLLLAGGFVLQKDLVVIFFFVGCLSVISWL
jgi:hypothetical protein